MSDVYQCTRCELRFPNSAELDMHRGSDHPETEPEHRPRNAQDRRSRPRNAQDRRSRPRNAQDRRSRPRNAQDRRSRPRHAQDRRTGPEMSYQSASE